VRNFEVTLAAQRRRADDGFRKQFCHAGCIREIERYQGFVLDMTEKKRVEDEMRRRNRELNALNAMAVIRPQSFRSYRGRSPDSARSPPDASRVAKLLSETVICAPSLRCK